MQEAVKALPHFVDSPSLHQVAGAGRSADQLVGAANMIAVMKICAKTGATPARRITRRLVGFDDGDFSV